jgi:hypothetical protein
MEGNVLKLGAEISTSDTATVFDDEFEYMR